MVKRSADEVVVYDQIHAPVVSDRDVVIRIRKMADGRGSFEIQFESAPELGPPPAKGYVRLHRLMIEAKLGRYLERDEVVHHKDGNTFNNAPANLEVTTREDHASHHSTQGDAGWTAVRRKRSANLK